MEIKIQTVIVISTVNAPWICVARDSMIGAPWYWFPVPIMEFSTTAAVPVRNTEVLATWAKVPTEEVEVPDEMSEVPAGNAEVPTKGVEAPTEGMQATKQRGAT